MLINVKSIGVSKLLIVNDNCISQPNKYVPRICIRNLKDYVGYVVVHGG